MEQMTGLDFKIQEMAARIRELRELEGLTTAQMAQKPTLAKRNTFSARQVKVIWTLPLFTVAQWH